MVGKGSDGKKDVHIETVHGHATIIKEIRSYSGRRKYKDLFENHHELLTFFMFYKLTPQDLLPSKVPTAAIKRKVWENACGKYAKNVVNKHLAVLKHSFCTACTSQLKAKGYKQRQKAYSLVAFSLKDRASIELLIIVDQTVKNCEGID
ncbi:hypothetical protein DOY81_001128 [Sarcophaga bullata]|nr:hypothetical protein DOY81_001128 [Sarcophaga bullata]